MKHLVIGLGEVGSALREVLGCDGHDVKKGVKAQGTYDCLHICFPYSEQFASHLINYRGIFNQYLTVIHSTVPVGTSNSLNAVYSPVRGVHPNLVEGLKTFTKYVAGRGGWVSEVVKEFRSKGIPAVASGSSSRSLEAAKLWDTTQHGAAILLMREIREYCDRERLDFETVYTDFNSTYNEGYADLGMTHYCRPILKYMLGPIGGHCVLPNAELLDSETAKRLRDSK